MFDRHHCHCPSVLVARLAAASVICAALCVPVAAYAAPAQMAAAPAVAPAQGAPGLLAREAVAPLVPPAVFFAGQVATTQARNAGAVRLVGDKYVVTVLVDTSGYSSAIQQKYQAYLITEAALIIDGHTLPAGAYGCGFIADNTFIVMDIGGTTLFTAHSTKDAELKRPTPLQLQNDPAGGYRLYAGRSYVTFQASK